MGFAAQYSRNYVNVEELEMRLEIFQANRNEVQDMNKHAEGVTFALNVNADLTNNEYKEKQGLIVPQEESPGLRHLDNSIADEGRNLSSGRSLNWGVTNFMAGVKS